MKYLKRFWSLYLITAIVFISLSVGADRAVTTIAQNTPIPRHHTIIIDAGHGGEDGGATAVNGVLESEINLQIAIKMRDLCHFLGYQTRMVRTTDVSVYTEGNTLAAKKASDLRQRVHIVNQTENAILISIHQNTFTDSRYHGAQVFYSESEGSRDFAAMLQQQLCKYLNPGSNRQEKKADHVYLMRNIRKTGILVECGFISNPEEAEKLLDAEYQRKLCSVIVCCLSGYINA